ncbi:glycosyltransferase family 39 protein [Flavobacterium sp.]|uniref:glycosyltransferase family 39 protein n=1 Tax=Flavobacterium sp. TaxID=239 RepID=UPI0037538740
MDEIYSMNVANPNESISKLISEVNLREGFPYFYFIILKILFSVFGYTATVARAVSAIAGILSVFAIYKLGKELLSKQAGLFAASFMALNEYNLYLSQDARPYSLYILFVIISFYSLVKLLKDNTLKNGIVYGVSAGLILSINFFGVINILSQSIIILYFLVITPKQYRLSHFKNYLVSGSIALLMFVPNYAILQKLLGLTSAWIPKPTPDSFSLFFKEILGDSEMTLFIFLPIFYYFLFTLFSQEEAKKNENIKDNKMIFSSIISFVWIFTVILFLMIKSYGEQSYMLIRYFSSITPVFFLIIGFGLYLIKNKLIKSMLFFSILIFTLVNLFFVKNYYNSINKAQFREAASFVMKNNKNGDPVFTSQKYWFDYYFIDYKIKTQEKELEALFQEMALDSTKIKPFWFVDAFGKTFTVSETTQNFINSNFYIENNYDGFQAWTRHFILLKDVPKVLDISKFKNLQQYNGDKFMLNVESFENVNNIVKTTGWAYFDMQDSQKSELDIVFIKEGKATRLMTQKVTRPDVTTYFKCDFDASNSGFSSTIDISNFEKGKYQLAIYLLNKETKKEGLYLTDKFFEK